VRKLFLLAGGAFTVAYGAFPAYRVELFYIKQELFL
jgi:hypothetical protein